MFRASAFAFLVVICCVSFPAETVEVEVFVSLVNVWVKAVDSSGNPMTDLTPQDFEIYEDGQKMNLDCFEQLKEDITKPPAENTVDLPKFVVYLDLLNTEAPDLALIKSSVMNFLNRMAPLTYEVMMVALLPNAKLGVVVPYTKNIYQIQAALEHARGNGALTTELKNNEAQIVNVLDQLVPEEEPVMSLEQLANSGGSPLKQKNTQILRAAFQAVYDLARQEKSRAMVSMRALESLGSFLAKKNEGAHTVILYISGGFNTQPGVHYYELAVRIAERKGFIFDRQTFMLRAGNKEPDRLDLPSLLRDTLGKLNRMNVTLYSVSTRGMSLLADASSSRRPEMSTENLQLANARNDSLSQLAAETGGLAFTNSQNFQTGFDRILTDLQHNYMLCYHPPEHKTPKYHEIKVVSKRPGVKLRHRRGYFD